MTGSLTLENGTVKEWHDLDAEAYHALRRYQGLGSPHLATSQCHADDLCTLIDLVCEPIEYQTGRELPVVMGKIRAQDYVRRYHQGLMRIQAAKRKRGSLVRVVGFAALVVAALAMLGVLALALYGAQQVLQTMVA